LEFLRTIRRKTALPGYVIVWTAFALRLWYWRTQIHAPLQIVGDESNYYGGAIQLARGTVDALTSDIWLRWHDVWLEPPLYTLSLVGPIKLLGEGLPALRLLQVLVGVLTVVLIYRLGWKLSERRTGTWSALLATIYFPLVSLPVLLMTENLFLPLLVLAFVLLVELRRGETWVTPSCAGLALGLATLTRTVTTFFLPFVAVWLLLVGQPYRKRALVQITLFAIGAGLAFGPWALRNYALYQRVLLTDTKGGSGLVDVDPGIEARLTPVANPVDLQSQVVREFLKDSLAHPDLLLAEFAPNALHLVSLEAIDRFGIQDFGYDLSEFLRDLFLDDAVFLCTLLLSLFGLASAMRRREALLLFAWAVYNLLILTVVYYPSVRYRLPVVILLMPCAGLGLGFLRTRPFTRPSPMQLAALGLGLVVLIAAVGRYSSRYLELIAEWPALHSAEAALRAGDSSRVSEAISEARAIDPTSATVAIAAGDIARNMGQTAQALNWYKAAERQLTDSYAVRLRLGDLYRASGQSKLAQEVLNPPGDDDILFLDWAWEHTELVASRPTTLTIGKLDAGFVRWIHEPGLVDAEGAGWPFRWTTSMTQLRLYAPAGQARVLSLYLAGARPPDTPRPRLVVSLNGRKISHFLAKRIWNVVNLTIPPDLSGSQEFVITLQSDPWLPIEGGKILPPPQQPDLGVQLGGAQVSDQPMDSNGPSN
jgi:4-amino-4-deoxy-L-arabinose transferase-like glycosyltransferase